MIGLSKESGLSKRDILALFGRTGPAWHEPLWEIPKRELNWDIDLVIAALDGIERDYVVDTDCAIDIWLIRGKKYWTSWKERYIVWCFHHGIKWPNVRNELNWDFEPVRKAA